MLHCRSQHPVLALFLILLFYFAAALLSGPVQNNGSDIPARAGCSGATRHLNGRKDLSATEKLVQQDPTETPETLDKIERIKSRNGPA